MKKPFYPLLFSIIPILSLAAQNMDMIAWNDPLRPLMIAMGLSAFLLVVLRLILRNWHRSALVTTFLLAFILLYGHFINLVEFLLKRGLSSTELKNLTILSCLAVLIILFGLLQLRHVEHFTLPLNWIMLFLLGFNLVSLLVRFGQTYYPTRNEIRQLAVARGDAEAGANQLRLVGDRSPDVYLLILDAYEGSPGLQKYYHFDNEPFLNELRKRGFYVADESRSNYLITRYSLPATLNMMYLNDLSPSLLTRMTSSLQVDYAQEFLSARGYRSVHFETWFEISNDAPADIVLAPENAKSARINPFEILLAKTTLAQALIVDVIWADQTGGEILGDAMEQDRTASVEQALFAFQHVPDFANQDGPHFVFSHFLVPHSPYLWGPNGAIEPFDLQRTSIPENRFIQESAWYYTGQIQYVNQLTLKMIDEILDKSTTPPIIILQGDHGHDAYLDWENQTAKGIDVRSSVLNAFYFPDGNYEFLYPSISPVNTFRVVFNQYFETNYPLLADKVYAHPPDYEPAHFVDACQEYRICLPEKNFSQ